MLVFLHSFGTVYHKWRGEKYQGCVMTGGHGGRMPPGKEQEILVEGTACLWKQTDKYYTDVVAGRMP